MKHTLAVSTLIFIAAAAGAQSVWSGNAAVGLPSDFPLSSSIPRAASNTFPLGTVLQVTNPATGLNVDVEVTGPVRSPGVFILVDTDAALSVGLPSDLMVPVRVSPKSFGSVQELTSRLNGDAALTDDIDYNPAAVLGYPEDKPPKEQSEEAPPAPVIIEEPAEVPVTEPLPDAVLVSSETFASSMPPEVPETVAAADKKRKAPAVPKFMPVPPPPVVEASAPEEPPVDEIEETPPPPPPAEPKLGDRESIIAFDLAEAEVEEPEIEESTPLVFLDEEPEIEETIARAVPGEDPAEDTETEEVPVETVPEEAAVQAPPKQEPVEVIPPVDQESGRNVYFLTPSDLRPPETPLESTSDAPPEPIPADTVPSEPAAAVEPAELIPPPEESSAPPEPLEDPSGVMERISPSDYRPYIQIGAYRDQALLSEAAREAANLAPGYPLSYAADTDESGDVYRLLIGPLQPAERGVVLKTARSSLFPDAFPYTP